MCSEGGALRDKGRQEPREKRGPGEGSISVSYCQMPEKLRLRMRERPLGWLVWFLVSGAYGPSRRTTE